MGGKRTARARPRLLVVAALGLAVPMVLTSSVSTPEGVVDAYATSSITIDLRADSADVFGYAGILAVGGDVHWRNRSGETRTVTSPNGLLDSGPIPDGGSFHASLPVSGSYSWVSEFGEGTIVVEADFTGEDRDRALDHIPDVAPPPTDPAEIGLHPELAIEISRTRAIIGISETATVAEARQALGSSWDIIGGLPNTGLVYAQIWLTSAPSSFATLDARVTQLQTNSAIDFVAYDIPFEESNVAPPSSDAATVGGFWEPPQSHPLGASTNWGLELGRVPQAWNLLDASRLEGAQDRSGTVVIDSGFETHVDLDRLQQLRLCASIISSISDPNAGRCTTAAPSDHGNHVAGIVGADFDGQGVTGVDPLSRLYGVPWLFERVNGDDNGRIPLALELVLQEILAGRLTDVDVINLSIQIASAKPVDWWTAHETDLCGPGADDDDTAAAIETCFPSNHDETIAANEDISRAVRRVIENYVRRLDDPPLFVNSTGNASATYCETQLIDCLPGTGVPQQGTVMSSLTWANANWRDGVGQNPIISVESIGNVVGVGLTPQLDRSDFSNLNGDISTSGLTVSTESSKGDDEPGPCRAQNGPNTYCYQNGTSQAAPMITGVVGLLSSWDPGLTAAELKAHILTWAIADTTDDAAPRVDAFASLLSLGGAAHALADVSDPSLDGNRRVVYDTDGSTTDDVVLSTTSGFTSEPDGVVDMRDFRRFRDAWLLRCQISPEAGCPDVASIDLDGAADHPKRDLNGDGCVLLSVPAKDQACPSELTFPRVDFNGDGTVSRNASVAVPLLADGTPAPGPAQARPMTDLQVFQSQFEPSAPGSLGVSAAQLVGLMSSGDLTLVADGLATTGASTAAVSLVDVSTEAVVGSYALEIGPASDDDPVVTVAAGRSFRLDVEAAGPEGACSLSIGPFSMRPGEDRTVDLDASLSVSLGGSPLRPGENAVATVSASSCNGAVDGIPAEVSITPDLADGAQANVSIVTIGADGTGTTTVAAGDRRGAYELTATAAVPVDDTTSRDLTTSTIFAVGEAYDLELAAIDGASSGYAVLDEFTALGVPVGPSVNGAGDVAFGAVATADDRYRPYITQPGDDPANPAEATVFNTDLITVDTRLTGQPELNDAGQLVYTTVRSDGLDSLRGVYRADPAGFTDEIATARSTIGTTDEPYSRVGRPTINESGRVLFVATDQAGDEVLAERRAGLVVTGPGTFGARPQLADDGTSVTEATISRDCVDYPGVCPPGQSLLFDPIILVGEDVQPVRAVIAEGRVDGFGALSEPDISPPGDVVAFVADLDAAAGLFVSIRRADGTWQSPIAVEGPSAGGSLATLVHDRPTVIQLAEGADGPSGDRLFIAVRGSESGLAADEGVFVVPVELRATGNATIPFLPVASRPRLVAQVGDTVDGQTIARLDLGDALAVAGTPSFDGDHWVAFYAEGADGSNMHIRARSLDVPTATAVPGGPGRGLSIVGPSIGSLLRPVSEPSFHGLTPFVASPQAAPMGVLPDDVVVLPGPHVAAVTVDDDTPIAREQTRITNRSRAMDGTPAWGIADETGTVTVLLNPEAISPDGELLIVYPNRGSETLNLGAPLSSGQFANDVRFQVTVQPGANQPPIGQIDNGPIKVGPGQDTVLRASGTDPDGDRLSYSWDLNDDAVFDEGSFSAVAVTAAEIQSIVCGGSCVLEQPYPIAVRVLDDRGLDVIVPSTITVSGFGEIVLRVDPVLVQANPGTSARAYVIIDKPANEPSVPVELSIENAPADWSISLRDEVQSGESVQMSIRVPDDVLEDSFTFDVVARTGDIERRESITVVTLFGLIPQCSGTVRGTVTDEAGVPIVGASIDPTMRSAPTVLTDENGDFSFDAVLSQGANIEQFGWSLTGPSGEPLYVYQSGGLQYIRCDEVTEFNPVMKQVPNAAGLTMRAVEGIENPVNPLRPLATDAPMAGVTFRISYRPERFTIATERATPADGRVTFLDLPSTSTSHNSLNYGVSASKSGYWSVSRNVRLSELDEGLMIDAGDFPLIEACSGRVTTARVIDQFGDPVEDASVRLSSPSIGDPQLTPADGAITLNQEVFLGTFNRPRLVSVRASAPSEWGNSDIDVVSKRLESCGDVLDEFVLVLERPEPEIDYFATLVGTVTDADTGEPIENAWVIGSSYNDSINLRTDEFGNWEAEVFIGTDPGGITGWSMQVRSDPDYWLTSQSLNVPVDAEVRYDAQLVRRKSVTLTGTVTDADTGDPIEGARVVTSRGSTGSVEDRTDANGQYTLDELLLAPGVPGFSEPNGPRDTTVQGDFEFSGAPQPEPYWRAGNTVTLTADGENVLDFQMIPVCDDASVSGLVVNAQTLEPLEGVEIFAGGIRTYTDAEGRYEVTGIRPSRNNEPRSTSVYARKDGFFDASIDVTTYCGAELIVDFGRPFGGFGTVMGTVTDSDSGDPLVDVFIGSSWGDSTASGVDGTYSFDRAPLTSEGADRDWTISAARGFDQLQQVVTVSADGDAVADFEFGAADLPPMAFGQALSTDVESPLGIILTGNDPEGASLTFTVVDGPTLGALAGTAPDLTYTPSGSTGSDELTFRVNDGAIDSELATITIDVTEAVNTAPRLNAPAAVEVTADTSQQIGVSADDDEGDDLEFSLTDDAGGRAVLVDAGDGTAMITIVAGAADAGQVVDVGLAVSDGDLGDSATITVTIVADDPINRPPVVEIDAPGQVDEGTTVLFDASGTTDPDGDSFTFAWTLVDFGGNTVATATGPTWSYLFDDDFIGAAELVVTDTRGEMAMAEAEIIVINVPPQVDVEFATDESRLTEAIEASAGERVDVTGSFSDPGADTHEVVVDWGDGTTEAVTHAAGSFSAGHTYGSPGTFTVVVEVCDDDDGCGRAGDQVVVDARVVNPPSATTTTTTPAVTITTTATTVTTVATVVAPTSPPTTTVPVAVLPSTGSEPARGVVLAAMLLVLGLALIAAAKAHRRPA